MYVPRARPGFHLPAPLFVGAFYLVAILLAILLWGVISIARIRTDDAYLMEGALPVAAPPDPASFDTVAYTVAGADSDQIWLMSVGGGASRLLATIPRLPGGGALYAAQLHGEASPLGDSVAVLSVPQGDLQPELARASLSLVAVPTGAVRSGLGAFDGLSPIAWAPDAKRIALVRSQSPDEAGRRQTEIVEVDIASGAESVVARFEGVLAAVPVGYSIDAGRLYIVTVDNGGSTLHVERDGELSVIGQLSAGKTRDWVMNADATRLAYVEVLSTSDRPYVGRTYHIAAAVAGELPKAEGIQLGVAWKPGSPVPDFGSMDGDAWTLDPPPESDVFVQPLAWSPDGNALITSIHAVTDGRVDDLRGTLELVVANRRVELEDGTRFLGFVRGQ